MSKPQPLTILLIVIVILIAGYYLFGWAVHVARFGVVRGTQIYAECAKTKNRNMPVEFSYPQNNAKNVPLHSLAVIKMKDGNPNIISSMSLEYKGGPYGDPVPLSASSEYFIGGHIFKDDAFKMDPKAPDKFPDIDIAGKNEEVLKYVQSAGKDINKIADYRTEGSWLPNKAVQVQIGMACYNPYRFEFQTAQN